MQISSTLSLSWLELVRHGPLLPALRTRNLVSDVDSINYVMSLSCPTWAVTILCDWITFIMCMSGWPLTWKTYKSQGIPKWSGKSRGETEISFMVQLNYQWHKYCYQPQCIKCRILQAQWPPGLFLINMKQQLLTIVLNSISMNLCLPYWKSRGILCALESGHPVMY